MGTLKDRPTWEPDPRLPPIPTFSPRQLRKNRIQSHRLAPRPPKNFPLFNGGDGSVEQPKINSDGRQPRVKSNLRQAKINRGGKSSSNDNSFKNNAFSKNEFRKKILRNRQRFDTVDFDERK